MKYLVAAIFILSQISANGATIVVGANEQVTTVPKGIEMANNGDTVLIRKGTYYINNIILTKQITILGEDFPVLHGSGKYQILTISGRNIRIEKIHFSHAGYSSMNDLAAVKIVDSRYIVIENNRFTHTYFAIHIANSADFTIRNNIL